MPETYIGELRDGIVVFEGTPPAWPTGTKVAVNPLQDRNEAEAPGQPRDWLLDLAARAEELNPDLPSDMAANHDHYAHGAPKRP